MSVKNIEAPFCLDMHEQFTGIIELGFNERGAFVVSAHTTPAAPPGKPRGSYFTTFAISDLLYRRCHRTHACFQRDGDALCLWDDWGRMHHIHAPSHVLDALVTECEANEIPAPPRGAQPEEPRCGGSGYLPAFDSIEPGIYAPSGEPCPGCPDCAGRSSQPEVKP